MPTNASDTPDTSLHQAVILDHYRNPRHRGTAGPDAVEAKADNPFCGDQVTVSVRTDGNRLIRVRFEGRGCTISQAAASMVSEMVEGGTVDEFKALWERFGEAVAERTEGPPASLGDLRALVGVGRFPNRVRCAMLAFEAIESAIAHGLASSQG